MSLYNNAASRALVSIQGANGIVNNIANAVVNGALSGVGASAIASTVQGIALGAAQGALAEAVGKLLPGGFMGSILSSALGGLLSQSRFWGSPTPLFGGISPSEAKRIYSEVQGTKFAKKNLWILEVSSPISGLETRFNLFATEVEYSPFQIEGDKRNVGGSVVDAVRGQGAVELRITTLDDKKGTLKRWFAAHHAAISRKDGTIGLPAEYAVRVKVVHAFITRGSAIGAYEDIGLYRPVSVEMNLSRREDGLEELQMSFSQLDTFMGP